MRKYFKETNLVLDSLIRFVNMVLYLKSQNLTSKAMELIKYKHKGNEKNIVSVMKQIFLS